MADFEAIYQVVSLIPVGRVSSYGAIAGYLGSKGGARLVGWAMNAAHQSPLNIPAQRVVNRNGMLTGKHHFDTPERMQQLLEKDGLEVKDDTVVDFKNKFWDPSKALNL